VTLASLAPTAPDACPLDTYPMMALALAALVGCAPRAAPLPALCGAIAAKFPWFAANAYVGRERWMVSHPRHTQFTSNA
jgi:hypothetical protein